MYEMVFMTTDKNTRKSSSFSIFRQLETEHNWAEGLVQTHKINLPAIREEYDRSETTTEKLLMKRIHYYCEYFTLSFLVS